MKAVKNLNTPEKGPLKSLVNQKYEQRNPIFHRLFDLRESHFLLGEIYNLQWNYSEKRGFLK